MIVALGPTDNSYFIAAEGRTYSSKIPEGMSTCLAGKMSTPIEYAAMGENGTWFLRGKDPQDKSKYICRFSTGTLTELSDKLKNSITGGVNFGTGGAWTWHHQTGNSHTWSYRGLDANQTAWVKKMKGEHGEKFRIFVGAGHATVLVYDDGRICYHSCGDKTGNTLSATTKKNLRIRYLALSPTHRDWFFIQFTDDTVTWFLSTAIADHIRAFAKDKNIRTRAAETL